MAYPDNYEDCTELEQMPEVDIVDYSRIQAMISQSKEDICECSSTSADVVLKQLHTIEGGIRQVVGEVVTEVNENQTLIESNGRQFKIII